MPLQVFGNLHTKAGNFGNPVVEIFRENAATLRLVGGDSSPCTEVAHRRGIAARIAGPCGTGHAAVDGVDTAAAGFCIRRASRKAGLSKVPTPSIPLATELAGACIDDRLEQLRPLLCNAFGDIVERVRSAKFVDRVVVQAFCEVQSVEVTSAQAGFQQIDHRVRWGIVADLRLRSLGLEREIGVAGSGSVVYEPDEVASALDALAGEAAETRQPTRAEAGEWPLVLSGRAMGMFVHEVVGHMCEADDLVSGREARSGRPFPIGVTLGPPFLCVEDDATRPGLFGSRRIDDAGGLSAPIPLIEGGAVVGHLRSRGLTDMAGVSCAMRADFRLPPRARMSNTVVKPVAGTSAEFVASLPRGILVSRLEEGEMDPATGRVSLIVRSAREIRRGLAKRLLTPFRIEAPARELLRAVCAVGTDLETLATYCASTAGIVPVGALAPAALLDPVPVFPLPRGARA